MANEDKSPLEILTEEVDSSEGRGQWVRDRFIELVHMATLRSSYIYKKQDSPENVGAITDGFKKGDLQEDLKIGMVTRMALIDPGSDDKFRDITEWEAPPGVTEAAGNVYKSSIYSPDDPFCSTPPGSYYRVVQPLSEEALEQDRSALYSHILSLSKQGANIICANELAYPAFKFPTHGYDVDSPEYKEIEKKNAIQAAANKEFQRKLQLISRGMPEDEEPTQPCIIIAGSYHDAQLMQNNAVIFFPDLNKPKIHRKLTTAKSPKVGEVVRTPPDPYFYTYDSHLGIVTVLICLDAYDLNMFYRQLDLAQTDATESPAIIIVPALSKFSLVQACVDLSYAARTVVIYVNPEDKHDKRNMVCYCGISHFTNGDVGAVMASLSKKDVNSKRRLLLTERTEYLFRKGTRTARR